MSSFLIDTHAHLYLDAFQDDIALVMERALAQNIRYIYLPAIDSSHTTTMLQLEAQYPQYIRLMMGLHPCSVQKDNYRDELSKVKHWLDTRPFAAIGEIGIDLYWDKSTLDIQLHAFEQQIEWALEANLPINIHSREAFDPIYEVLSSLPTLPKGIFHCFSGTIDQAYQLIAYGMKLGIGGVATFKNGNIAHFLADIPLENIVLETDAPYLTPVPFRGKRNESSYLTFICNHLANLYQTSATHIRDITSKNARETYVDYTL